MLVRDRMTRDPVTVTPETSFQEALKIIRERKIRRLPVLDERGHLVGIVAEKDLLYASPSPATSLSIFEMHYLLAKLRVKDIMTREVITTTGDTPLEDAACLMVTRKIGCLPVVEDGQVVGIITETDIFKTFVELLGGGKRGLRLTLRVPERKGVLAAITGEITKRGGNILNLGTFAGADPTERFLVIRVQEVSREELIPALEALGEKVIEAREV
ncbi:MAG TPA: CBS domain-containing protein [Anaerolineae bacterium]|nr:CBS domain-containing protein [Anaerolineae bacterium]